MTCGVWKLVMPSAVLRTPATRIAFAAAARAFGCGVAHHVSKVPFFGAVTVVEQSLLFLGGQMFILGNDASGLFVEDEFFYSQPPGGLVRGLVVVDLLASTNEMRIQFTVNVVVSVGTALDALHSVSVWDWGFGNTMAKDKKKRSHSAAPRNAP